MSRPLIPLAALLAAFTVAGCASTSALTEHHGSGRGEVRVTGTVARVCPGPIVDERRPRCYDSATLTSADGRFRVAGRFSVLMPAGNYRVTVDGCRTTVLLRVHAGMRGVQLDDRCPIPV